jgi:uncharacterized membrane protein YeiH
MVRDVLVGEIPTVLRTDIYARAALIGATILVGARALHLPLGRGQRWTPSFALELGWGPCTMCGGFWLR